MDEKQDLKTIQKEVHSLRSELNKVKDDRERWFKKKEELKKQIAELIVKIKGLKRHGDLSTEEAKKLRTERDQYNKLVKKLIEKISSLQKEKKELIEKYKIEHDTEILKKNIQKLEEKIETEALTIDKEKRLMQQIKRLKKYYNELSDVKAISDKITEMSKEIEETKKKADEAHKKFKEAMKERKSGYKEFFNLSSQINVIKKQQERAFEMFISLKNSFFNVSRQLQQKLNLVKKTHDETINKEKLIKDKIIEEKTKDVEKKIKKGEKLTTEDLLVLQSKESTEEKTIDGKKDDSLPTIRP